MNLCKLCVCVCVCTAVQNSNGTTRANRGQKNKVTSPPARGDSDPALTCQAKQPTLDVDPSLFFFQRNRTACAQLPLFCLCVSDGATRWSDFTSTTTTVTLSTAI